MATLQELEAELSRRERSGSAGDFSWSRARDAFIAGTQRGGYSVATLPALPGDIARTMTGQPSDIAAGGANIPKESDFPGYERYFRAGEGAGPGAAFGAATGAPLGPAGILGGTLVGALGGAISNIAGKEIFPTSTAGQMAVGLLAPGGAAVTRTRAGAAPSRMEGPVTQPTTGITETAGQRFGSPRVLMEEEKIRRSVQGAPIASSFDVAQAQSVDDFLSKIQKFSANPKLSDEQISQGIYKAYDNFATKLQNQFKATNTANFAVARKEAGDLPVIPTTNVQNKIDELIAKYDNPEVIGMQSIVASLRRIKSELTTTQTTGGRILNARGEPIIPETTTTAPSNITIERLQQNLAAWGDAAYKGTYSTPGKKAQEFADVTPGMVKGIARQVLNAFKSDLDIAAETGVQGAASLKKARDVFGKNLQELTNYSSKPLVKYFDEPTAEALVPEKVVDMFVNLPPSQKADAASVLRFARPDIWESLRYQGLNKVLEPARVGESASAGTPKFDIGVALKQMGSLKDPDIQWLFPSKEEKNLFRTGLEQIQRIQRRSNFMDMDPVQFNQAARTAAEAAGTLGGAVRKYGVQTITDAYRLMVGMADEQKMAYMMFDPNGRLMIRELAKPNPNLDRIPQAAINTLLAGPLASTTVARPATVPGSQQQAPQQEQPMFTIEALEEELARRQSNQPQ